jgi:nucleotide-binding universal stress UspA family protein
MLHTVNAAIDQLTLGAGRRESKGPRVSLPTYRRIVVAYDGSAGSKIALAWAKDLAKRHRANVTIATVFAPPQVDIGVAGGYGWWPQMLDEYSRAQEAVRNAAEEAAAGLKTAGIQTSVILEEGTPVARLVKVIEDEQPDLVIVGSRGAGPLARWMLGSVSTGLLDRVRQDILIAREPPRPGCTLVATDGSHASYRAVAHALRRASETNGELVVQHVLAYPEAPPGAGASGYLKGVAESIELPAAPPRVRYVVDVGRPAERIIERAAQEDADLIVLGSRGLGSVASALLGSVSRRIVHASDKNVLVVREGAP